MWARQQEAEKAKETLARNLDGNEPIRLPKTSKLL
jgi:hypothetical protein